MTKVYNQSYQSKLYHNNHFFLNQELKFKSRSICSAVINLGSNWLKPVVWCQVVLGGGRRHWLPKVSRDPEDAAQEGRRADGKNLIDDWVRDKRRRGLRAEYVWNKRQLDQLDLTRVDRLLGE